MGLLDSALSVGGSLLSGALNNDSAMQRQEAAQAFSAQQYATRYQTTVKDLQAAGLNPMLAYNGLGNTFPSMTAASSSGYPDLGATYNNAISSAAHAKQAQAAEDLVPSQEDANYGSASQSRAVAAVQRATVDKIREETSNIHSDTERLDTVVKNLIVEREKVQAEIHNVVAQNEVIKATVRNLDKQGLLFSAQSKLAGAQTDQSKTQTNLNDLNDALLRLELRAKDASGNFGNKAEEYRSIIDLVRSAMGMFGMRSSSSTSESIVTHRK